MRTLRPFLLTTALTALLSSSAFADGSVAVDEAELRFREGKQLFDSGHYEAAHVKFLEACAAHPTRRCSRNLGLTEYRLGKHSEAAQHLREYLQDPESSKDDNVGLLRNLYGEETGKVAQLRVFAKDGAAVKLDDRALGRAPLGYSVFVEPGKHVVGAKLEQDERSQPVDVKANQVLEIDLRPVGDTTPGPGKVDPIFSTPLGTIVKTESYRPTAGYVVPGVLAGLGLVGVAVGIGFGAASQGAKDVRDATATRGLCGNPTVPQCQSYTDRIDTINADSTLSIVGYVSGLTLLAASVVSFLVWPKHERSVTIAPQGLGLAIVGSF